MSCAIQNVHVHIDNGIPSQNAFLQSFLNAVTNSFQELQRNISAGYEILDRKASPRFVRTNSHIHSSVHSGSAVLPPQQVIRLRRGRNGLAVSNSWSPGIHLQAMIAFQTFNEDFKVQFTHSGNNRLAGFGMSKRTFALQEQFMSPATQFLMHQAGPVSRTAATADCAPSPTILLGFRSHGLLRHLDLGPGGCAPDNYLVHRPGKDSVVVEEEHGPESAR